MALNAGSESPLQGRRERQERLSREMGQLLLRGYRMLGQCCPQCGTILLQDKQRQLLCISCQELGGAGGPPTAAAAPDPQASTLDPQPSSPAPQPSSPDLQTSSPSARPEVCEGAASGFRGGQGHPLPSPPAPPAPSSPLVAEDELGGAVLAARAAVLAKLGWAARELPRTSSAEGSAQLCALVRACAEALGGLRALGGPPPP